MKSDIVQLLAPIFPFSVSFINDVTEVSVQLLYAGGSGVDRESCPAAASPGHIPTQLLL